MKAFVLPSIFGLLITCGIAQSIHGFEVVDLVDQGALSEWESLNGADVGESWEAVDGVIHLKNPGKGASIVSKRSYRNFDLQFEWKITEGGNSGIKYRVRDYEGRTLGLEYQLYDDAFHSKQWNSKNSTASIYDIIAPQVETKVKPIGEFNHTRIVVEGNKIEHWLNGEKIIEAYVGSPDWKNGIAEIKFAKWNGFALNHSGKLMLQDHKSEIWIRNFELVTLAEPQVVETRRRGVLRGRIFRRR